MLQPARSKYRKQHKGRNRGLATTGNKVSFGDFGLKAIGRGRITARQIEAGRRVMTRHIKRGGRVWIRIFPDKPITKKPAEVRMGKGKGSVEYYVAEIQPGKMLYEMDGVSESIAREAFKILLSALARSVPPTSGATHIIFLLLIFFLTCLAKIGVANKLSTGISKKPCI